MNMEKPQFWSLDSPDSTARLAEWVDDEMDLESIVCPVHDGHQRAGKRLTDLSIALRGRVVQDFVWTWYNECLIQDHVLDLFNKKKVTGFEVKPVKVKFKRKTDRKPPKLWELIVTGWAGIAPPTSGIKLIEHCDACGSMKYSGCTYPDKLIDVSQWDGSDVFVVWPATRYIFITDRVAQVISENRLCGAVLKQPGELRFSSSGTLSSRRLSYWMPEARARELGESLGIY